MHTPWKAGVASMSITPDEPMWLAGWAVRTAPSRGTLTDLHAKALAVEDANGGRFVLLAVELIGVSREMTATVAARVGLPRDRLTVVASHTHSGPEVRPDKVPFFGIPPEYATKISAYVDWLTLRLVGVVGAALADLRSARLSARRTTAAFAHNRRGADAVDPEVPVLDVTDPGGHRRAVVFGYACHNTTLPPDDGRYSGDYSGFAAVELEADDPGAVALFVAGAGADQDPDPRGGVDLARRHGAALADAVRQCLATPGREIVGPLRAAAEDVPLDFQPMRSPDELRTDLSSDHQPTRRKAEYLLARREPFPDSYPCPVQAVRFGDDFLLVALGGEPTVDFAHEIRRRHAAPGRTVWVAGYANDMFGYVPSARVLREGGYEGGRSVLWSALPAPFAADTEGRVLAGVARLVARLEKD